MDEKTLLKRDSSCVGSSVSSKRKRDNRGSAKADDRLHGSDLPHAPPTSSRVSEFKVAALYESTILAIVRFEPQSIVLQVANICKLIESVVAGGQG